MKYNRAKMSMKRTFYLVLIALLGLSPTINAQVKETISQSYDFNIDANKESPTEFIQQYVLDSVQIWQKKGRYETTAEYTSRVTEENRQSYAQKLARNAEAIYIQKYYNDIKGFTIADYDADNESFLFKNDIFGKIVVPVPRTKAEMFEKSWRIDKSKVEMFVDGNNVFIKKMPFIAQGETFWYDNTKSATFAATNASVLLPDLVLDLTAEEQYESRQQIGEKNITVGKSDVDVNIPKTSTINDKTFVMVIANENYKRVEKVPFAINDGKTFSEYCHQTLGIPTQNIKCVYDATLNDIRAELNWLKNVLTAYNGEAKAIVYYSGHGIPDEKTSSAYLLPTDGYGTDIETAFSLETLYQELGSVPSQRITYFVDACFSGSKKEGDMLIAAKGVAIKAKPGVAQGNSVVFSAATGDQTAYPYSEKQHGLFTYYLLKKLQETGGDVSYQDLGNYIQTNVRKISAVKSKIQTPTIVPGTQASVTWKIWNLK